MGSPSDDIPLEIATSLTVRLLYGPNCSQVLPFVGPKDGPPSATLTLLPKGILDLKLLLESETDNTWSTYSPPKRTIVALFKPEGSSSITSYKYQMAPLTEKKADGCNIDFSSIPIHEEGRLIIIMVAASPSSNNEDKGGLNSFENEKAFKDLIYSSPYTLYLGKFKVQAPPPLPEAVKLEGTNLPAMDHP